VVEQNSVDTPPPPVRTFASVRIVVPWSARVFALLRMVFGFFMALALLGLASEAQESLERESFSFVRYILMVGAGLMFVVAAVSGWSNLKAAFARRARLEVLNDRLAIYHGGVFRHPTAVAWDDVETVAFDDRPFRYKRSGSHQRFDLMPEGLEETESAVVKNGALRWLFSRSGGAPLPLLGQVFDVPNVAVLFKEPKVLRPIRRFQKAFPSKVRLGPPIHKRKSRGLLMRVKDAPALREALEPWGIVRPITRDGLAAKAPPEEDRRKARRTAWRDNVILYALLLGQAAIPLVIALND
jgi:hypothetical protein